MHPVLKTVLQRLGLGLLTLFVVPTLVTLMARKRVAGPKTEPGPVEA